MALDQPPPIKPFLRTMLYLFAFIIGIETGAACFTSVVVFPAWASSAEAARGWLPEMPYHMEEGDFFMYASSLSLLASIITLIAGWRAPAPLRKWIHIASWGFIIVFVWSMIYFVPIQDTDLKGEASASYSDEELEAMLRNFVRLNYVRIAMMFVILASALQALRLSGRNTPITA